MYHILRTTQSDINEHLPTLKDLASKCGHVTEMGTRKIVSTWAFAEGLKEGDTLIAIDYKTPEEYGVSSQSFIDFCKSKGINFSFIKGDTREIEIQPTDLLFIDTNHFYDNLKKELELHSDKAQKYIVLHDTVSCADELIPAVNEFIALGKWKIEKHYTNNNGVMILTRC